MILDISTLEMALDRAEAARAQGEKAVAKEIIQQAFLNNNFEALWLFEVGKSGLMQAKPNLVARLGFLLDKIGLSTRAAEINSNLFESGYRERTFVQRHLGLLTGEQQYQAVIDIEQSLDIDATSDIFTIVNMYAGHARLALCADKALILQRASLREATDRWYSVERCQKLIQGTIQKREPFSWVRLGDGESRVQTHNTHQTTAATR